MEIKKIRCYFCRQIKEGAVLSHYNLKVCVDCFPYFFRKRVQETIEKFRMFNQKEIILVALSGGKDSMSILKALKDLNYNIEALHIDTGIGEVSEKARETVQEFCEKESIKLKIVELNQEINLSLKDLSKISKKPICAVCGMLRRYILNREASGKTIVTGHTLNDEVAFILKNMIFWNDELLSRIDPVLHERESLSRKVKPLCLITEQETKLFCETMSIKYINEACPHRSEVYEVFKKVVLEINNNFPGSIIGFYKGYLKRQKSFYLETTKSVNLQQCRSCGYITVSEFCSICRLKEKVLKYKNG
ncbi:MAG: ATP-binding protein [Thermodesulfovibrio sp.]|nr:adenine nucleotide alpha hydrolase family protein [Thermodesulfovibrio sp.]MDW7998504.1 ATP-binding protein [Thermodesulfovibrio sp.]